MSGGEATFELARLVRPELVFLRVPPAEPDAFLTALAERLAEAAGLADAALLGAKLAEREALGTTALGRGVAVPHCKLDGLVEPLVAVAVAKSPGIDFGAEDEQPVRLFFVVISPESSPVMHLKVLAAISHQLQNEGWASALLAARKSAKLLAILRAPASGERRE